MYIKMEIWLVDSEFSNNSNEDSNNEDLEIVMCRVVHECCNPDFKRTKLPMHTHKMDHDWACDIPDGRRVVLYLL